jgi:hypothetical protein
MESILTSIKKKIGIQAEYTHFDDDIIMEINSAISDLRQVGVGPSDGFRIHSDLETWTDFLGDSKLLESAKTYIYIKAKLVFDPPTSSFVVDAMNKRADEILWRLNVESKT